MKLNLKIEHSDIMKAVVGVHDRNLFVFKDYFGVQVSILNDEIITDAPESKRALLEKIMSILIDLAQKQVSLNERDILYIIKRVEANQDDGILSLYQNRKKLLVNEAGKSIFPKTIHQLDYVKAIESSPMVFGVGPAGTGKTFLAVVLAVAFLKQNKVKKIIITRPVVEAGESLGFLPGDLKEKVDPYLIPLYDALYELLGKNQTDILLEKGIIEIAPLAYMRGRTLENAFIILDEAQNTTQVQMKMFLTRLGLSSKMVITGDPTQIDLMRNQKSGLLDATKKLEGLQEVLFITFDKMDVIRHPLVQRILERYETSEN